MNLKDRFRALGREAGEHEEEEKDKAIARIEETNQAIEGVAHDIKKASKEFAKTLHYKFQVEKDYYAESKFKHVKNKIFLVSLYSEAYNIGFLNIAITCGDFGVNISPRGGKGSSSVTIPFEEFSAEKLAESLETAHKEMTGVAPKPSKTEQDIEITDWRGKVSLRSGEYIVETFELPDESEIFHSFGAVGFALTNSRLIILKTRVEKGRTTVVSFDMEKEFPLDDIQDIAVGGGKTIIYTAKGKYETEYWDPSLRRDGNYLRKRVIDLKGKKPAISVDFSSLKSVLEKGGIVLTTLSCPKCNATIRIPTDGSETVCEYCGSKVVAQDIFKKLKTLLS